MYQSLMYLDILTDKKIAILGYGVEGQSTLQFLLKQGIPKDQITILDKNKDIDVPIGCSTHIGEDYLDDLETFYLVLKSPGITPTLIEEQTGKKIPKERFMSQTQLFFNLYKGIVIGVTGTKGKSTIATVLDKTLKIAGFHTELAGNVGKPVLDIIDFTDPPQIVVYELSSFMLESLHNFRLDIGIFTTLYPTHTAEHGNHQAYIDAKLRIINHSRHVLLGHQVKEVVGGMLPPRNYLLYGKYGTYTRDHGWFYKNQQRLFSDVNMLIPGEHNRHNMCAIIGVIDLLEKRKRWPIKNPNWRALQDVLQTFSGLEHRLENVGTHGGMRWINDAIATTPQATMAAIESFGEEIDTLFYGGIEGQYDHSGVAELIVKYTIKNLILFPDTGAILEALLTTNYSLTTNTFHTRSMQEAVTRAKKHTQAGKIALLSCGSPSFSCWSGFVEKGRLFKEEVDRIE